MKHSIISTETEARGWKWFDHNLAFSDRLQEQQLITFKYIPSEGKHERDMSA